MAGSHSQPALFLTDYVTMPAMLENGLLSLRTRRFFPSSGRHRFSTASSAELFIRDRAVIR